VCGGTVGEAVVDRARREVVDEPWFLVVLIGIIVGLLAVVSCVVVAIIYQRHVNRGRKTSKQPVLDGQLPRCQPLLPLIHSRLIFLPHSTENSQKVPRTNGQTAKNMPHC